LSGMTTKNALKLLDVIKGIGKKSAFFGGTQGTATGLNTYGQTGDAGKAVVEGLKAGLASGAVNGALNFGDLLKYRKAVALNNAAQDARSAPVLDNLTPEQIKQFGPQPISVHGAQDNGVGIGVRTPLKVGVKDVSATHNVQVRTPTAMTAQDYVKRLDQLGASYDKATAKLKDMPPAQQKIYQAAIDTHHQNLLNELDKAYQNPQVAEGSSKLTRVAQQTTKAPKNTGGTPKGFINTDGNVKAPKGISNTPEASSSKNGTMSLDELSQRATQPTATKVQTANLDATKPQAKGGEVTMKLNFEKDKTPTEPTTVAPTRKEPTNVFTKTSQKAKTSGLAGSINPRDAAARAGNIELAKLADQHAIDSELAAHDAHVAGERQAQLEQASGQSHNDVIRAVESGNTKGNAAAEHFAANTQKVGKEAVKEGVFPAMRQNYVPRKGQFMEKSGREAYGISKSSSYTKKRSDAFQTHQEFKNYVLSKGGKVEGRTHVLLEHNMRTVGTNTANARFVNGLEKTHMADGRPAAIRETTVVPENFRDYKAGIVQGRLVHPEAAKLVDTIVHPNGRMAENGLYKGVNKVASTNKRFVTVNGVVHGKNFFQSSMGMNGLVRTVTAGFKGYSHDLARQAISDGVRLFRQGGENLYDTLTTGKARFGKIGQFFSGVRNKMDRALFEGYGNRIAMTTYSNIKKQAIKSGLSEKEAGRQAALAANKTVFSVPLHEQSTYYKDIGRLMFFAKDYFQSSMKNGVHALGFTDKAMSKQAQHFQQKTAIKALVRAGLYSFAAANAINYAVTGHSTLQNKGQDKFSPVFYVDKATGKEYHITNFFGQVGEMAKLLTDPTSIENKFNGIVRTGSELISNH
ncbi:MAG TPA: hypothetical protein VN081_06320, partial [Dongiaceae bacterium]|nr:hypothetical protein [Dongiaceae bacterium]